MKNEKQHRLLFIIPAVIIAIILIICIAVAVSSKSGEKGSEKTGKSAYFAVLTSKPATICIDALFCEVNPIPVKKAMELLGWNPGPLRLPLVEPSEEHTAYIQRELAAMGCRIEL